MKLKAGRATRRYLIQVAMARGGHLLHGPSAGTKPKERSLRQNKRAKARRDADR